MKQKYHHYAYQKIFLVVYVYKWNKIVVFTIALMHANEVIAYD